MTAEPQPAVPEEGSLTTDEVAAEAGATYRQIDMWCRQGYLRPDGGLGTGYARRWPRDEVEVARRMARLVAADLSPSKAADFARNGWPEGEIGAGIRLTVTEDTP
jgi:hypothetical protein